MRLARGTPPSLLLLWLAPLLARRRSAQVGLIALAVAGTWFFRDPYRAQNGGNLVAAADGRVRELRRLDDSRWLVSTYLDLRDVHVTRSPCDGTIVARTHLPGSHRPAFGAKSKANERVEWRIDTSHGDVEVIQIAGTMVRRIVPYLAVGDAVRRGDRMGLIRFGSRVDVILPRRMRPMVDLRQRLRAGITAIATADVP